MSWRTSFGAAILMALASACGGSAGGSGPDGSTGTDGGADDGRLEGYAWSYSSATITMLPDVDPSMNGNLAADVDATLVEMNVTLAARPDAESEDDELPITSASVRIGAGPIDAEAEGDFEWFDLVHQGDGVYTASTTGAAALYRVEIDGPAIGTRVASIESIPTGRVLSPIHGGTHSASASLPLEFEPILSGIWAERYVDGERHGPATSNTSEQESLSITSTWLHPGATQEIGLHRFRVSLSFGSTGEHGVAFGERRTVDVQMQ